jgi:hypothetical protein
MIVAVITRGSSVKIRVLAAAAVLPMIVLTGCGQKVIRGTGSAEAATSTAQATESTIPPTSTPTETPTQTPTSTGSGAASAKEAKEAKDVTITDDNGMQAVLHLNKIHTQATPGSTYGEKPESGTYIVVDVRVTVKQGNLPVNPLYFAYTPPGGKTLHIDAGNGFFSGFKPLLTPTTLDAGRSTTGLVVFDAELKAGATLHFESALGDDLGGWTLAG